MKYFLLFLEGVLAFLSPCMLPMLPIYLAYLAAESGAGSRKTVANTFCFVLGFTIVFVLMGASATALGSLLNSHRMLLQRASGAVIIAFGLQFLGVLKLDFLGASKKIGFDFARTGFVSAMLFGAFFALGWTPCLGPLLGSALLLAGNSETVFRGMFCLFVFSLGIGLPYLIAAFAFGTFERFFVKLEKYGTVIERISGIVLIVMGIMLAANLFYYWQMLFD